jgi:hypothetical protein
VIRIPGTGRSKSHKGKDDINNSLVFFAQDPLTGHIWLYVTGDRKETNGTSYLDIELYQNAIFKTGDVTGGGFTTNGPNGGRTIGDLDLTLDYTGGGSVATISVLVWSNVGTDAASDL